jgi:LmbE family N-acetylglucosaminyl deacetylase
MLKFHWIGKRQGALKILCIGAHSDDIEIGCGGAVLRILKEHEGAEVHWVVLGSGGQRDREASASANRFLSGAGKKKIIIEHFKTSYFPYKGEEIKNLFEAIKKKISPDIIFTHYRHDLHQDHRQVSELTWNTFRDHFILEYEIIKYDGDIGVPNFFVHLEEAICRKKIEIIMESFKTQRDKDWFTQDTFFSMLRIRGVESRAPEKFAEGFYCRKIVY